MNADLLTDEGSDAGTLTGRTAVVTGAGSGIGAAIARAFVAAGANVALCDRNAATLSGVTDSLPDHRATSHVVDVTVPEAVSSTMDSIVRAHGAIDILVNSAGILTEMPFLTMDTETWDETINANLRSVFLCCRFAVPYMVDAGWGRVINIASQLGQKGEPGLSHYCAAKAGVMGFTRALAREVARQNVLANAIAPGPIDTPLAGGLSEDWKARKEPLLPLGRVGVPEEVAPTAVMLASDPGGNLYVGQTLGPNSGDVMS